MKQRPALAHLLLSMTTGFAASVGEEPPVPALVKGPRHQIQRATSQGSLEPNKAREERRRRRARGAG
jgi:hypothetical protein